MFRKNEEHRQWSFSSGHYLLPDRLQEKLLTSWAETFYHELFCHIDVQISPRCIAKRLLDPTRL